jgi:hypothetical protein
MRSVSAALAAAITSAERVIRHRLTVDWDDDGYNGDGTIDDLTGNAGQIKSTQQLQTQVPEAVRVVAGAAAAQLDVDLARGNVINKAVPVAWRGWAANGGSTKAIAIDAPTTQPGDVVLISIVYQNATLKFPDLPNGGNVAWTLLGTRGESQPPGSFTERAESVLLTRRAVAGEPSGAGAYTFTAADDITWMAAAMVIGEAGIAGIHAYVSNGQDDGVYRSTITNAAVPVTLPGAMLVSFHWGWLPTGRSVGSVTSPNGGTLILGSSPMGTGNLVGSAQYRANVPAGSHAEALTLNPPTILNTNPDFEVNLTGWGSTGTVGSIAQSTAVAHRGTGSMKITPNGASSTAEAGSDPVNVTVANVYTASGWLYCLDARNASIVIDWLTAGGALVSSSVSTVAIAANTWTYYQVTGTAPATTAKASMKGRISGTPPGTTALYVDQMMLRAGANSADVDVRVEVGFTVALAPAVAGSDAQHAAWTFSEMNPLSPYAGKSRLGRRVRWLLEYATSTGFQSIPLFTGLSLDASGSSRGRAATLRALDNREVWRDPVQELPEVLAEWPTTPDLVWGPNRPGLDSTWLVSWLFSFGLVAFDTSGAFRPEQQGPSRGWGYFAAPNFRSGNTPMLYAPFHGSATPFVGRGRWAYTSAGAQRRMQFDVGPYVGATEPTPGATVVVAGFTPNVVTTVWTSTGQSAGRFEYCVRVPVGTTGQAFVTAQHVTSYLDQYCRLEVLTTRQLQLTLGVPGPTVTRTVAGPTLPNDGAWHWIGCHWDSTTGNAKFSIDGVDTVVAFSTWTNRAITNDLVDIYVRAATGGQVSDVHVTGGVRQSDNNIGGTPALPYAAAWIQTGFTPTAFIDKSDNLLDAAPAVSSDADAWDIVTAIAEAEFSSVFWDADGRPHFRTVRSDTSTVGQTVQRTLSATSALKELDYVSGITQIRNSVTVEYTGAEVHLGEPVVISGVYRVPAGGSISIPFSIPGRAYSTLTGQTNDATAANTQPDGSGTNVTYGTWTTFVSYPVGRSSGFFNVSNANIFDIWLVDTSGQSSIVITESWVQPSSTASTTVEDVDSIRAYRRQPLGITTNPFRQRAESAAAIAARVVADLKDPHPTLRNIKIVGDPRLEIGDLVRVVDSSGLGVDGNFRITGLAPTSSARGGFEQTITARAA